MTKPSASHIPDGFIPHGRTSPLTDPWEPLYAKSGERHYNLGTVLREAHCNSRRIVHGGFLSAIADNAMGLSAYQALRARGWQCDGMVTVNLSIDFLGQGALGAWFQTDCSVVKIGRGLAFVESHLLADGVVIARANATFKLIHVRDDAA